MPPQRDILGRQANRLSQCLQSAIWAQRKILGGKQWTHVRTVNPSLGGCFAGVKPKAANNRRTVFPDAGPALPVNQILRSRALARAHPPSAGTRHPSHRESFVEKAAASDTRDCLRGRATSAIRRQVESGTHTRTPKPPARCASDESGVTTRSSWVITAAVSRKSRPSSCPRFRRVSRPTANCPAKLSELFGSVALLQADQSHAGQPGQICELSEWKRTQAISFVITVSLPRNSNFENSVCISFATGPMPAQRPGDDRPPSLDGTGIDREITIGWQASQRRSQDCGQAQHGRVHIAIRASRLPVNDLIDARTTARPAA